ncbi:unnamed protein product [Arctia plantaginis]|uniref:Major facilitator superfamily (MFS) profile domain-containing protein n=1 Tax=Arctia plantaginis TaxID=874455 RepID=A0A8S0Z3M9_ARCPL|nr:unnamed protein product [Arctia plantaginis]
MIADKSVMNFERLPMEAALDKVGFGLYGYLLTVLTGYGIISFACIAFGSMFIVPTSACELQTTSGQQGLLAAGPIAGLLIGGLAWGYLADTRGRRSMLLVSLSGAAFFNLIATISVNWVMLMIFQFFSAIFASGIYLMLMSLLSESVPMAKRNYVVLLVSSIFLLSQGIMAVLALPIIPLKFSYYLPALGIYWNSWRTLLLILSLPALSTAFCLFFMYESPKFLFAKGNEARALDILRKIHRFGKSKPKEELGFSYYLPALGIYWNSWRTLLLILSLPALSTAFCLFFMYESPKFLFAKGNEARALDILRKIHRFGKSKPKEELGVKGLLKDENAAAAGPIPAKDQIVPLFRAPLLKYTIIICILYVAQQMSAFVVWLPTIANQFIRITQTEETTNLTICDVLRKEVVPDLDAVPCALNETSLLIVLGVGALHSVVNIFISILLRFVGRRNISIAVIILCGVSGILVNLVPNVYGSAVFLAIMTMAIVVIGLYTAITIALFPTHLRGMAIALSLTSSRIGTIASVQIVNLMLFTSCDAGFYLFSSILLASAIAAFFLPDDRKLQAPVPAADDPQSLDGKPDTRL